MCVIINFLDQRKGPMTSATYNKGALEGRVLGLRVQIPVLSLMTLKGYPVSGFIFLIYKTDIIH